jgi:hypothetical protein
MHWFFTMALILPYILWVILPWSRFNSFL